MSQDRTNRRDTIGRCSVFASCPCLVVVCLAISCARQTVAKITYVLPPEFVGVISVSASSSKSALSLERSAETIRVPADGAIRLSSLDAYEQGVDEVFVTEDGHLLESNDAAFGGDGIYVYSLGRGKHGGIVDGVFYFVGTPSARRNLKFVWK